tara:strand:+ start:2003 stop:2206 length:204 start_codon:yes stop_codon:yes gene_type:complete
MQVSRQGNRIIIDVAPDTDLVGIQRLLDYIRYREIASKSQATQENADELAQESKASWWKENKDKFIK